MFPLPLHYSSESLVLYGGSGATPQRVLYPDELVDASRTEFADRPLRVRDSDLDPNHGADAEHLPGTCGALSPRGHYACGREPHPTHPPGHVWVMYPSNDNDHHTPEP